MERSSQTILLFFLFFIALGCAASETSKSESPSAPSSTAGPTTAVPASTTATKPDTVDWNAPGAPLPAPAVSEVDREGVAESLGLIGPLVAVGGKGSDVYVLVFDPAGVLVGALTQKEVKQDPQKLEKLVALAHDRSEVQNYHALQVMNAIALRSAFADRP